MDEETNNLLLYESLKKKYQEKHESFVELSNLVSTKIKILNEEKDFKIMKLNSAKNEKLLDLEKQKSKIDKENERIDLDFLQLELDEKALENNKIIPIDFVKIKQEISLKNIKIESEIKIKQKDEIELNEIKQSIIKEQDSEVLNVKVELKSNQLSGQERELYLKGRINTFEEKCRETINEWNKYANSLITIKEELLETIQILKDEINDNEINKKLERERISNMAKQWNKEQKTNKNLVTKFTSDNENLAKEIEILKKNQNKWHADKKKEYIISIDEIKHMILDAEVILKNIDLEIGNLENNIKDVDKKILSKNYTGAKDPNLEEIRWNLRKNLGDLNKKRLVSNDKYQSLLIELNNIQKTFDQDLDKDPFKNEIAKISIILDKNQSKIEKIKKQEHNFIESQKVNQLDGKKKIVSLQIEIKSITEEIEVIDLDYKNQKIRYDEDMSYKMNKLSTLKEDLKDHYKYMNDFKNQSRIDTNAIIEKYKHRLFEIELKIKKNNDEIALLKNESQKLFKDFDNSVKKYNLDIENERKILLDLQRKRNKLEKEKIGLNESYSKYAILQTKYDKFIIDFDNNINDIKLRTMEEIINVNKILNDSEQEISALDKQIKNLEVSLSDVLDSMKVSSEEIINLDTDYIEINEEDIINFSKTIDEEVTYNGNIQLDISDSVEILNEMEKEVDNNKPKEYDLIINSKEQWDEFEDGFDVFLENQSEINYDPKDELNNKPITMDDNNSETSTIINISNNILLDNVSENNDISNISHDNLFEDEMSEINVVLDTDDTRTDIFNENGNATKSEKYFNFDDSKSEVMSEINVVLDDARTEDKIKNLNKNEIKIVVNTFEDFDSKTDTMSEINVILDLE